MKKRSLQRLVKAIFTAAVVCVLGVNAEAQLGITTTVVNDNFVDGDPANNGLPGEVGFFSFSTNDPIDNGPQTPGVLDLASGNSFASIFALFTPQTLSSVGDRIDLSIDYNTPATVRFGSEIRFGLFDTSTSPGFSLVDATGMLVKPNGFADDIEINEPGLIIRGILANADINEFPGGGDLEFRSSDVANGTGRLTSSPLGFSNPVVGISSGGNNAVRGTDDGTDILFNIANLNPAPNSSGTIGLSIELLANDQVQLFQSAFGETFTVTGQVFDVINGRDSDSDGIGDRDVFGVGTVFDSVFLSVPADAFGTSNDVGDPDNGLDITNVTVSFTTAPEPGAALLLLFGLGAQGFVRRRRQ